MAAINKAFNFVPSTSAESAEVNQNFDDLFAQINANLVHADGSVAFTGIPAGPATDPTTDNQFTRKRFVDQADLRRAQIIRVNGGVSNPPMTVGTHQPRLVIGHVTVFLDAQKRATINLGTTFGGGLVTILAVCGGEDANAAHEGAVIVDGYTTSSFRVTLRGATITAQVINYIAIGW